MAASSSMAAVLDGIWRKTVALLGLLPLYGLLIAGEEKSRNGDFLTSGESWNDNRQTWLMQKLRAVVEADVDWIKGFRFLGLRAVSLLVVDLS